MINEDIGVQEGENHGDHHLGDAAVWLIPAAIAGIAGLAMARLAGRRHQVDESPALEVPPAAEPPADTAIVEPDERIDPGGIGPLILILEALGLIAGMLALAFISPPAYYASLVAFGPLSLLGLAVIVYHLRVQRAAKREEEK